MAPHPPVVVTGQQIGAGWTPALSVVKALTALAVAQHLGGRAVYWMADEDHDRLEVATTLGWREDRILRHRFEFQAPEGTATGWLEWTERQQREADTLWGRIPLPTEPTLRGHVLALGAPLWRRGIEAFSPTDPAVREPIQDTLTRWRELGLEARLSGQAQRLEDEGETLVLDPRKQSAWFCLDPRTGLRRPLEPHEACPPHQWLSPGAALRPLMQSLLLPVTHAVLGPAERAYWRLTEPLWELVGLAQPEIIARPSVYVAPPGTRLSPIQLEALRHGYWEALVPPSSIPSPSAPLPSTLMNSLRPDPAWGPDIGRSFAQTLATTRRKLIKLDRRFQRDLASETLGGDPERLRQKLFPFGKPQERVIPGLCWLRNEALLDGMLDALGQGDLIHILEEP